MSERRLLSVLAALAGLGCAAQDVLPGTPMDADRIELRTGFQYDSNTLLNELVLDLTRGGFIARDVRERSGAGLRPNNRLGQVLEVRLQAVVGDSVLGRSGLKAVISAGHHDLAGLRFRPDVYDLTFFGNASFAGRRADLSFTAFERQRYQTVGFGLHAIRSGSWVRLDLVKGQSLNAAYLQDATLLTALDGTQLDIRLNGTYMQSDTAGSGIGAFNGTGAALAFAAHFAVPGVAGGAVHRVSIGAEDVGVVSWNRSSLHMDADTSIVYDGISVENVFDLDAAITGEQQLLDTFGLRRSSGAFWRMLPLQVWAGYRAVWSNGWQADLLVAQRALPGFIPFLQATGWRKFGPHQLGLSSQFGGSGGLRAGVHGRLHITRRAAAEVRLPNLLGLLSPRARGMEGFMALVLLP